MPEAPRIVYRFDSSPGREIWAQLTTGQDGRRRADLRIYRVGSEATRPTSYALNVTLDVLPELQAAVEALVEAAREERGE
jgi:hypothetical protein